LVRSLDPTGILAAIFRKLAFRRCDLIQKLAPFFTIFFGLCFPALRVSLAQAPIDPTLPEAPVPNRHTLFSIGADTVPDSTVPIPYLRTRQKYEIAFHKIVSPSILVKSAMITGFDRGFDVGPRFGGNPGDVAELYAYTAENLAASYLISSAILPTALHQDPRFFRKDSGSIKSKIFWALRAEVVAYSDQGKPMPNYSHLIGFAGSAAFANVYLPSQDVSVPATMKRYGLRLAVSGGFNILHEFDVFNRVKNHYRRH
jgi:hypothetical protein